MIWLEALSRSTRPLSALGALGALLATVSGCSVSYNVRSPEDYRQATRALLESKESDFKQCYANVIAKTPDAQGSVTVQFTVEEKTGKILTPASLPTSTAPEPLQACVVNGLNGLKLDPPDQRTGAATMTFDFARG
jgi:hypothetical protein